MDSREEEDDLEVMVLLLMLSISFKANASMETILSLEASIFFSFANLSFDDDEFVVLFEVVVDVENLFISFCRCILESDDGGEDKEV